jgi:hypothetical protein
MATYNRYRIVPIKASTGEPILTATNLLAGITEATARAIQADVNRNASINGRITYRLEVRDIREPGDWATMGQPDAMALPEVSGWSVCPDCGPARCIHVVC